MGAIAVVMVVKYEVHPMTVVPTMVTHCQQLI